MTSHLSRVLDFVCSQVWAMEPGFHQRMMNVLLRHDAGIKLSDLEIEAATGKAMPERATGLQIDPKTGIATIPIHGVIAHRAGAVGRASSRVGTSVEHIRADLRAALEDESVKSILLDVDSPGGSVAGIAELADEIRAAREQKPIVAHTDSLMASAAYWLSAQADRVFATRSAQVGSIGVITAFYDGHRRAANEGFDPVVIKSAPGKGSIQSNGSMSDSDRADIQRDVDAFHAMFVEGVAQGRRIETSAAAKLGDGRVHVGKAAVENGMADGLSTRAQAIKHLRSLARERGAAAGAPYRWDDIESTYPQTSVVDESVLGDASNARKEPMDPKPQTPPVAQTVVPAPTPTPAPSQDAADERNRIAAIFAGALPEQRDLRDRLVAENTPIVSALQVLLRDTQERLAQARLLPSAATPSLASGNTASVAGGTAAATEQARVKAMPEGEEKWKAEFAADAALQTEFGGDVGLYLGWRRNERTLAQMKGG